MNQEQRDNIYFVRDELCNLSKQIESNNLIKRYKYIFKLVCFDIEKKDSNVNGVIKACKFEGFLDPITTELLTDLNSSCFFIFESAINELYEEKLSDDEKKEKALWKYTSIKKFLTEECNKEKIKEKLGLSPSLGTKINELYKKKNIRFNEEKEDFFNISRIFRNKLSHANKVFLSDFNKAMHSEKLKKIIKKWLKIKEVNVDGQNEEQIATECLKTFFNFIKILILNLESIQKDLS